MKIKMLINKHILIGPPTVMDLEKDNVYEVVDILQDTYKVVVPMKQKGKFRYALIKDEDGILVE